MRPLVMIGMNNKSCVPHASALMSLEGPLGTAVEVRVPNLTGTPEQPATATETAMIAMNLNIVFT